MSYFCADIVNMKTDITTYKLKAEIKPRQAGQRHVLQLTCEPLPIVRIALIGLGTRGSLAVNRLMNIEGAQIAALCDIKDENLRNAQNHLKKHHQTPAAEYIVADDWRRACENPDIDLIYICTDWLSHVPIAVYAMEHGKHVAIEVPAALTVDECWQLVDTAERTRRHCMMLENCCYDFFELNTLNMIRQGLFGEVMHAEGAYLHDLRSLNFPPREDTRKGMNRQKFSREHTGNLYPTHGLGPVCMAMKIHRDDKMNYLVSMSTRQQGITDYAGIVYGHHSPEALQTYRLGDMNTTLIRTENEKTIMIQHNISNPRPYSRIHSVTGTRGYFEKYPLPKIAIEPDTNNFLTKKALNVLMKKYEHPFIKQYGKQAKKVSGSRALDFIMDSRLIYCLRNGLPLDMDVYDAAEWSCLTELTELSVTNGSCPVEIPDFTRGDWKKY